MARSCDITVIVLHKPGRPYIFHSLLSIMKQILHPAHIIIIIDGNISPANKNRLYKLTSQIPTDIHEYSINQTDQVLKIQQLRLCSLDLIKTQWFVWLDDDNWWNNNHLSSLYESAKHNPGKMIYSYRLLWLNETTPYTKVENPWQANPNSCRRHSRYLDTLGIRPLGASWMRDGIFPDPFDGYYGTIDLGAWVNHIDIKNNMYLREINLEDGHYEDDFFLKSLINKNIDIIPTGKYTLNYRIGGTTS